MPLAWSFIHLAALIGWFSRKVLASQLSITMDVGFCIEATEEAMAGLVKPKIFNVDHGSQSISQAFTTLLIGAAVAISMDGKGTWRDFRLSNASDGP